MDRVQGPAPLVMGPHSLYAPGADFCDKHRPEPVPPVPNCLMADLVPAFVQQVVDISKRRWEPYVQCHHETDNLVTGLEAAVGIGTGDSERLNGCPFSLRIVSFDSACQGFCNNSNMSVLPRAKSTGVSPSL